MSLNIAPTLFVEKLVIRANIRVTGQMSTCCIQDGKPVWSQKPFTHSFSTELVSHRPQEWPHTGIPVGAPEDAWKQAVEEAHTAFLEATSAVNLQAIVLDAIREAYPGREVLWPR